MKIDLKNGLDNLLFGMKTNDVVAQLGLPNRQFQDEDGNTIYLYDSHKLRLTFYADEDFRLGYAITSYADATLLGHAIIGEPITKILDDLPFSSWETEEFDSVTNYFNESNWLTLQVEYGQVIRVEIGALIDEVSDVFIWRFKG